MSNALGHMLYLRPLGSTASRTSNVQSTKHNHICVAQTHTQVVRRTSAQQPTENSLFN